LSKVATDVESTTQAGLYDIFCLDLTPAAAAYDEAECKTFTDKKVTETPGWTATEAN